ncbi:hypothetical protein HY496_02630 [Candidatus Woesearchaeota archaeon]|nr:hypothetical protein [Candidatus Woesearchaeota archaeon]
MMLRFFENLQYLFGWHKKPILGEGKVNIVSLAKYQAFNKNDVLPDSWWFDTRPFDCQQMLEKYKSSLATVSFNGQKLSDRLNALSKAYKLNTKIALLTLEREQSLVRESVEGLTKPVTYMMQRTDGKVVEVLSSAKQVRLDWACGFGVPDLQPRKEQYRGLDKQIDAMMMRYRDYSNEIDAGKWQLNAEMRVDADEQGKTHDIVYPANKATFSLYRYTPHVGTKDSPLFKKYQEYGAFLSWTLATRVFWKQDFL